MKKIIIVSLCIASMLLAMEDSQDWDVAAFSDDSTHDASPEDFAARMKDIRLALGVFLAKCLNSNVPSSERPHTVFGEVIKLRRSGSLSPKMRVRENPINLSRLEGVDDAPGEYDLSAAEDKDLGVILRPSSYLRSLQRRRVSQELCTNEREPQALSSEELGKLSLSTESLERVLEEKE